MQDNTDLAAPILHLAEELDTKAEERHACMLYACIYTCMYAVCMHVEELDTKAEERPPNTMGMSG